jgi:hypothetical protein
VIVRERDEDARRRARRELADDLLVIARAVAQHDGTSGQKGGPLL